MKLNPIALPLTLAFGFFGGAVFAQQNLIKNSGFETGPAGEQHFPDWDWIGPADNNSDYGVAESTAFPNVAEQGNYYAFFHGHPTDGSQDCLGQTVYLTVGAQYTISYYLGTDGPTAGSGAAMWVVIGTSFGIDYSQDALLTAYYPNSSNALPYQLFTTNYIATQPSEILSFHGVDSASSILLDNVTMTATPPQLSLSAPSTNGLTFIWMAPAGYVLQANTSLDTANWVTLTNTPATAGATNQITLPTPTNSVFYRIAQP